MFDFNWNERLYELLETEDWWERRSEFFGLLANIEEQLTSYLQQITGDDGQDLSDEATISPEATIEGRVVVRKGATILPGALIVGPVYIGESSIVGPNCKLSCSFVASNCWTGNGSEVKRSILLDGTRLVHFGYIGYSLIGRNANFGAGSVIAVRRFDNAPVKFRFADGERTLGFKGGAIVGDNVQFGVNSSILPGRTIGPNAVIHPNVVVRRNIEAGEESVGTPSATDQHIWSVLMTAWNSEADRYWARNGVFLAVSGGLLVFMTAANTKPIYSCVVALFGFFLTFIWSRVNTIGKYYLDRWKPALKELERPWSVRPMHSIADLAQTDPVARRLKSSSKYMLYVIQGMRVLWILVLLAQIFLALASLRSSPRDFFT